MIGKCNTGGGENLTTQLNNQDAIITELEAKVETVCAIDITPEVTAQTPLITQIAENFGVEITTPTGTNKQILQGNNANLLNIKNNAKKEGAYVWKKLTAEGGDFADFAVDNDPTAYPDGGEQDGYWYEKVTTKSFGIDFGEITITSRTSSLTINHGLGKIPNYVAIVPKQITYGQTSAWQGVFYAIHSSFNIVPGSYYARFPLFNSKVASYKYYLTQADGTSTGELVGTTTVNETEIVASSNTENYKWPNGTYMWFALV